MAAIVNKLYSSKFVVDFFERSPYLNEKLFLEQAYTICWRQIEIAKTMWNLVFELALLAWTEF